MVKPYCNPLLVLRRKQNWCYNFSVYLILYTQGHESYQWDQNPYFESKHDWGICLKLKSILFIYPFNLDILLPLGTVSSYLSRLTLEKVPTKMGLQELCLSKFLPSSLINPLLKIYQRYVLKK